MTQQNLRQTASAVNPGTWELVDLQRGWCLWTLGKFKPDLQFET